MNPANPIDNLRSIHERLILIADGMCGSNSMYLREEIEHLEGVIKIMQTITLPHHIQRQTSDIASRLVGEMEERGFKPKTVQQSKERKWRKKT